jgi:hypothetical protein
MVLAVAGCGGDQPTPATSGGTSPPQVLTFADAPPPVRISFTTPAPNAEISRKRVRVRGSVSPVIARIDVTVVGADDTVKKTAKPDADGNWTVVIQLPFNGGYRIFAQAATGGSRAVIAVERIGAGNSTPDTVTPAEPPPSKTRAPTNAEIAALGEPKPNEIRLYQQDFDSEWPFARKLSVGMLRCDGADGVGAVTVRFGARTYAVNGLAKGTGSYLPLERIWPKKADGTRPDVSVVLERGLLLC